MRLVARHEIDARLRALDLEVSFRAGEELHTELSCKFRRETVEHAFAGAGLVLERWIPDGPGDFALALGRVDVRHA
jgi:L-histidine N-alpha-methyltransferase